MGRNGNIKRQLRESKRLEKIRKRGLLVDLMDWWLFWLAALLTFFGCKRDITMCVWTGRTRECWTIEKEKTQDRPGGGNRRKGKEKVVKGLSSFLLLSLDWRLAYQATSSCESGLSGLVWQIVSDDIWAWEDRCKQRSQWRGNKGTREFRESYSVGSSGR